MIIGINGKIGVGKDTVGEIIQKLCVTNNGPEFEIRKFAGKLKIIASLLTGIPVEKFEDQEFKKTLLGPEWGTIKENPLNSIPVFEDVKFLHMMSVRKFLQKLGTDAMRDGLHENVWVNALFANYPSDNIINEINQNTDGSYGVKQPNWIITDMRFPNEMEAVKERKGITIRVTRPVHALSQENHCGLLHPSETSLDNAEFHYTIVNDSTIEDLIEKVRTILIKEKII